MQVLLHLLVTLVEFKAGMSMTELAWGSEEVHGTEQAITLIWSSTDRPRRAEEILGISRKDNPIVLT